MLNYISNSVVAFYFPESVLSYCSRVLTLLFLKGTCSETKYCFLSFLDVEFLLAKLDFVEISKLISVYSWQ